MTVQTVIVLAIVSAAALFIAARVLRTVRAARNTKAACVDCGCETPAQSGDWSKT
jgi:hypothetical protein